MLMNESKLLSPNEVARLFSVSPITVRQWAQKGLLESQPTPGGHRRFSMDAIENFASSRGVSLSQPEKVFGDGERVLIVEDDEQLRSFLVELFSGRDGIAAVDAAGSAFEAGRKVESLSPSIVLLDLMLPGIDGIQLCKQLKGDEATRGIRVIAMTGYYTIENVNQILAAGAETCFSKPLDIPKVLATCTQG
jgi:excisionase family DNA binding protein